jgi:sialate O-acetylesterase
MPVMRRNYFPTGTFTLLFSLFCSYALADVRLPQLIADRMVLQRDIRLKIWGWASPGEKITLLFNGKKAHTVTLPDGKWLIPLPEMKAGGPYTMTIKGRNEIASSSGQVQYTGPAQLKTIRSSYPSAIQAAD